MGKPNILDLLNLNAVLYYADYLSLHDIFIPVTDTCKYYIVYGMPINAAYIAGNTPVYNTTNKYYEQALSELYDIQKKLGQEGVSSFLRNLCNVFAVGNVNGIQMLNCILFYEDKRIKRRARHTYKEYMENIRYTQHIDDEDVGDIQCTKYVTHTNIKPDYNEAEKINRLFEGPKND